jgi:hypothetical protein
VKEVDRRLGELARRQHGAFSRAQARAAGLSSSALYRRIARDQILVCGTAALHLPGTVLTWHGELQAGLLDLGPGARVSGRAAAQLLELDGFNGNWFEYLVPRSQRDRKANGLVHSTCSITALDCCTIDGLPCVSATRDVVELLAHASLREAGNALDSACRKHLTAQSVVRRRLEELGRQGRRGVAIFEQLMKAGAVESWLERRFLDVIRRAGLPVPMLQQRYELADVGIARVDFEYPLWSIVVEVGGQRGYLSLDERRRQERRRNALQLEGKTIYFFTREDVERDPGYVVRTLTAALTGGDCTRSRPA